MLQGVEGNDGGGLLGSSGTGGGGLVGLGGIGGEEGGVEGNDVLSTSSTSGGEIRILQGWTTTFSTMTPLTGGS